MFRRATSIACLFYLLSAAAGCDSSPPTGAINGEVTLDGQPLAQGNIQFTPVAGDTGTGGAEIKDGKFTAIVPVALMRVAINANKVVGKRKSYAAADSPEADVVQELIPPKYNFQSELKVDVKQGTQDVRFDLLSK